MKNFITLGGSPFYDLVLLVIDPISGISSETAESIRLFISKKIPFVIVLNKIDRIGWDKICIDEAVLEQQDDSTRDQFNTLSNKIILQFAERAVNDFRGQHGLDTSRIRIGLQRGLASSERQQERFCINDTRVSMHW